MRGPTRKLEFGLGLGLGSLGSTAATASASFTGPGDISDMLAWYDASTGVTEAATVVSAWADQSGNGNDLGVSVAAPTYAADGGAAWGNQPVIQFDGTDDAMTGAFSAATTNPWSFVVVVSGQGGSASATTARVFSSAGAYYPALRLDETNHNFLMDAGGTNLSSGNGTVVDPFAPKIVIGLWDTALGRIILDGSTSVSGSIGSAQFNLSGIIVANWKDGTGRNAAVTIGDLIVYDKGLSATEMNNLGAYFATKYGLSWSDVSF